MDDFWSGLAKQRNNIMSFKVSVLKTSSYGVKF